MQENEMIAVAPADREQALALRTMIEGARSGGEQALYRSGAYDHTHEVQAFARHRQQAEDAMRERCAVIADQHRAGRMLAKDDAVKRKARSEARDHESMAIEALHIATAIRAATLSKEGE